MTFAAALPAVIAIALAYLALLGGSIVFRALRTGGRRDDIDEQAARAGSRFTIPVSVIVPVRAVEDIDRVLTDTLRLNYPELELIVVASAAAEAPAFGRVATEWQLEANEFFYRQSVPTAPVNRIYRSGRDPRVLVVDKVAATRADAMNCGVNVARFRYLAVIVPGLAFDEDALLRLMAKPLRDPAAVLGASAHIERTGLFERLASVRAIMESRLFWRHRSRACGTADQVYVWRRDIVIGAKGFATASVDPAGEMVRRAVTTAAAHGAPARFYRSGEIFGRAARHSPAAALHQRGIRQRAVLRQLRLLTPRSVRAFGPRAIGWLLASTVLAPLAELTVVGGSVAGALSGRFTWAAPMAAFAAVVLGRAIVTTAALLTRGVSPAAPDERELAGLLAAAPIETLVTRPLALVSLGFAGRR